MGLLIKFVKWVVGQTANYWFRLLMGAVALAIGVSAVSARDWIERMFMLSLWPVAVPRYLFWPWLFLTFAGLILFLFGLLRGQPATAQKNYGSDVVEDFLWRWDVSANRSNATPYGTVFNLKRFCPRCGSVRFKFDLQALAPTQALVTCDNANCQRATPVTDLNRQEERVKVEVERRAVTNEWKGDRRRIRRAAKVT